jgi:hypothetical protein
MILRQAVAGFVAHPIACSIFLTFSTVERQFPSSKAERAFCRRAEMSRAYIEVSAKRKIVGKNRDFFI